MHPEGDLAATRLRLTDLAGATVAGPGGERLGRVADVLVVLSGEHPSVSALLIRPSGGARRARLRVPLSMVGELDPGGVVLGDLPPDGADMRPDEVALVRDVLDVQIVDVDRRRVARVGEVVLAWAGDELHVVAVDAGWRAILRRLGLRRLADRADRDAIDWAALHVASGRAHALQLAQPSAAVRRLDGAGLAELVARIPRASGAELLRDLPADRASVALATVDPDLGADLVEALPLARATELLEAMPEDEAADALRATGDERRGAVLRALGPIRGPRLHRAIGVLRPHGRDEPRRPRRYWNVLRGHAQLRGRGR